MPTKSTLVYPEMFDPDKHWYDKALNATIHPMVNYFFNLDHETIVNRYCHLNPKVNDVKLLEILQSNLEYFKWAGADLINVTTADGKRQMVVIENNSCPSGQKSMPLRDESEEMGGYIHLVKECFLPLIENKRNTIEGELAMVYDKNPMETTGYAAAIAELTKEKVHLITYYTDDPEPGVKWENGIMYVYGADEEWHPIRACMRYLTQKPWNRIPLKTKTKVLNPIISCLAGGRNKLIAAKAYNLYNAELIEYGLSIKTPETIWDVRKNEIPLWVNRMGGHAVIKIPYSNAGQGVFTIVNQEELDAFMSMDYPYERFIVQSLIGNYHWSSKTSEGKYYHVGTMPDKKGNTYVADIRFMVVSTPHNGIRTIGLYSRRAKSPLLNSISESADSWSILGTNLSYKNPDGTWNSDTSRLMLSDRRDFNRLGLSLDDLIETFIQTVLSMKAIDNMAIQLYNSKGTFRKKLFYSLNDDEQLLKELMLE